MAAREWHSKKRDTEVYHNNPKCGPGSSIKPRNRVSGRGGKHLCQKCQEMNHKNR